MTRIHFYDSLAAISSWTCLAECFTAYVDPFDKSVAEEISAEKYDVEIGEHLDDEIWSPGFGWCFYAVAESFDGGFFCGGDGCFSVVVFLFK